MIGNLWCWTRECARILRSPMCPWVYPHYLKGKWYVHSIMSLLTFQPQGYRVKKRNWKADSILAVRRGGRQLPNAGPTECSSMLFLQIRDCDAVLRGNKDIKTDLLSVSKKERERGRSIWGYMLLFKETWQFWARTLYLSHLMGRPVERRLPGKCSVALWGIKKPARCGASG